MPRVLNFGAVVGTIAGCTETLGGWGILHWDGMHEESLMAAAAIRISHLIHCIVIGF